MPPALISKPTTQQTLPKSSFSASSRLSPCVILSSCISSLLLSDPSYSGSGHCSLLGCDPESGSTWRLSSLGYRSLLGTLQHIRPWRPPQRDIFPLAVSQPPTLDPPPENKGRTRFTSMFKATLSRT